MKRLFDFFPLMVFFIFYKLYDIYHASGALIVASTLLFFCTCLYYQKIPKVPLAIFILVVIFNFLTLYYHNTDFIKWKVTVIYALLGSAFLINQFISENPLIQCMLDKDLRLPKRVWSNLNIAWAGFFLVCGTINIYIAFWLPQSAWVAFKVFGLTFLTLVFTTINGIYIYRHMGVEESSNNTD